MIKKTSIIILIIVTLIFTSYPHPNHKPNNDHGTKPQENEPNKTKKMDGIFIEKITNTKYSFKTHTINPLITSPDPEPGPETEAEPEAKPETEPEQETDHTSKPNLQNRIPGFGYYSIITGVTALTIFYIYKNYQKKIELT
jgi:outer membrane biosynthesis protein TonB